MESNPCSLWKSPVSIPEVVIVRPAKTALKLECGGHPMIVTNEERLSGLGVSMDDSASLFMGKRCYFDGELGLEVLASKAGAGSLSLHGRVLLIEAANALSSSD